MTESRPSNPPQEPTTDSLGGAKRKPRMAVVGARRVRTGTGPFLALQAADAGAEVSAVIGTTRDSAEQACSWLAERGLDCNGFLDWEEMLAEVAPDAIILASPAGTHLPWLKAALAAGVHVLCEKPLLASARIDLQAASRPAAEDEAATIEISRAFASAGLLLRENCQWPFTLGDFGRLHPDADLESATYFKMLMSPSGSGITRWLELLSHPLSLLQAIAPGPVELIDPHYHDDCELRFTWCTATRNLECLVEIVPDTTYPRPAVYQFGSNEMRREIEEDSYNFFFSSGDTRIAAADPMPLSVARFIAELIEVMATGAAPIDEDLVRRQKLLGVLLDARPESTN